MFSTNEASDAKTILLPASGNQNYGFMNGEGCVHRASPAKRKMSQAQQE